MNTKETYHKFIKSEWWRYLRNKRISRNKFCEACGNKKYLNVHHANYETKYRGQAKVALKNTFVLCSNCHNEFHKHYGVKNDMIKETINFIKEVKMDIKQNQKLQEEFMEKELWLSKI